MVSLMVLMRSAAPMPSVLLIDTNDCSYDQYAIADKSEDWAEGVIAIIKEH